MAALAQSETGGTYKNRGNVSGDVGKRGRRKDLFRLITDEGVAVGGAFDSDMATGMLPVAHRVAGALESQRS